jgi:arylsulfatase A-like enzyme
MVTRSFKLIFRAEFETNLTMKLNPILSFRGLPLAALMVAGNLVVSGAMAADRPAKPNILFIAVDDLRPELGCYGVPVVQSPNIDRLAKKGMVFDRAYCQQAVCSPSRTSLLTGTRPDTTKVWNLSTHFRKAQPDIVTLPQLFRENGYFTKAMGKIFHHGLDDQPSWSVPTFYPNAPHGAGPRAVDPDGAQVELSKSGRGPVVEKVDGPDNSLHDGELADMAVKALADLKQKKEPWLLAVGFIKPHLPFNAPKKYFDQYDPAKIPLAPNPFFPIGAPKYAVGPGGEVGSYSGVPAVRPFKEDFARKLKLGYYACVSYMDAQVGRVLDELERQGLSTNTIVILWGDHGWKLGEHQAWAKHTNVENDTRAPLMIYVPGMANAGKHTGALVEFVDVYPTLAELAGLPLPKTLEGTSLKPLLDDPQKAWKTAAFSQYPRGENLMGYTMRTDRYRLTRWVNRKDHSKVDAVELYDHLTDPQENTNVVNVAANQAILEKLTAQWEAGWQGALPKRNPRTK